MEDNKIEPGDVVTLKSGGPEMTVESNHAHEGIECSWFAGEQLKRSRFSSGALAFVNRPEQRRSLTVKLEAEDKQ